MGKSFANTMFTLPPGGDEGPVLVPGRPEQCLLVKAVSYTDENLKMPPSQKLSPAQVAAFSVSELRKAVTIRSA